MMRTQISGAHLMRLVHERGKTSESSETFNDPSRHSFLYPEPPVRALFHAVRPEGRKEYGDPVLAAKVPELWLQNMHQSSTPYDRHL